MLVMASYSRRIILGNFRVPFPEICNFSSSSFSHNKWRISRSLEPNPNSFGPLTNLPDYSYVDGRPLPLSQKQKRKIKLQQQYCETIVRLSHEMDEAVKYQKKLESDAQARQNTLSCKFKPKGAAVKKFKEN